MVKAPLTPRPDASHYPQIAVTSQTGKKELFSVLIPHKAQQFNNHNWLSERAIIVAKNKVVDDFNAPIQNFLPGKLFLFKSVNTVINQDDEVYYPTKLSN